MNDLELSNTAQTAVGSDGNFYRPSHLLRGGRSIFRVSEAPLAQQPELSFNSFIYSGKQGMSKWHILNREEVLVPIIATPVKVRETQSYCFSRLLVANHPVIAVEREIQRLLQSGESLEETHPWIFEDAITIGVFTHFPMNEGIPFRGYGMTEFVVHGARGAVGVACSFPTTLKILGQNAPGMKGWMRINPSLKQKIS